MILLVALALQATDVRVARVQSLAGSLVWDNPALHAKGVMVPAAGYRLDIVELAVGRDGLDGEVSAFALLAGGNRSFAPVGIGGAPNTMFPLERLAIGHEAGEILKSNAIFAVKRHSASRVTIEAGPLATVALLFEVPLASRATSLRFPDGTLRELKSEK